MLRISLVCRDIATYRMLFARRLSGDGSLGAMQRSRNRGLRVADSLYETMSEIVAIVNSCALLIVWDIDTSGGTLDRISRAKKVVLNAVLQIVVEWFTDFMSILSLELLFDFH